MAFEYTPQEYNTPLDIANRALQHCGAKRVTADDFANPVSKRAASVNFVYDKLRRAELNRNVWRFAIKRAVIRPINDGTLEMAPLAWSATTVYERGAIASYNGITWVSHTAGSVGIVPGTTEDWDCYFGPLTVSPFDNDTGYYLSENVFKTNGSGRPSVFSATTDASQNVTSGSNDPGTSTPWVATNYYNKGDVIQFTDGFFYRSFIDVNYGNTPSQYPLWNANTNYINGAVVAGTDAKVYVCKINNTGQNPTTDTVNMYWMATGWPVPWLPAFSGTSAGLGWIRQNVTLKNAVPVYPIGCGPLSQSYSRNIFRLPNGYLRRAPQSPKSGVFPFMGFSNELAPDDYVLEGNFLTSELSFPIPLRFMADFTLVSKMDSLFCEGLAARIALEICEELTQSAEKSKRIADMYKEFMTEARMVNGIETGPTDPPEEEYVTARL